MSKDVELDRRHFLGAAAMSIASARLGVFGAATDALVSDTKSVTPPPHPFAPLKQIDAGVLNVGYAESGPADGRPVLLLHGWPYDINSFVDVALGSRRRDIA